MMKLRTSLIAAGVIIIIAVVAMFGLKPFSSRASSKADSADQWEYLIVAGGQTNLSSTTNTSLRKDTSGAFSREQFPVEQNLDKLGTKGWELVSVYGNPSDPTYYFKRHKN